MSLLYVDVPKYYRWLTDKQRWIRRTRGSCVEGWEGVKRGTALGRIYTVSPLERETFFLRHLLHHVSGPTSFSDLRTVEGIEYSTYHEACVKHGLLHEDNCWEHTLEEAATTKQPSQIRNMFAIMIASGELSSPFTLMGAVQGKHGGGLSLPGQTHQHSSRVP